MNTLSKNAKDEDTSGIYLAYYNKQDAEVKKFRINEEPHKFDELIDSIKNRDLDRLKNSIQKICKYCFIFSLLENDNVCIHLN